MRSLIKLIAILLLLSPLNGWAHGYWIEVEGNHKIKETVTVKLFFGEYVSGERLAGNYLDRMKDIRIYVSAPGSSKQPIVMKQLDGYWEGTFIPEKEGSYEVSGINDEREVQDWTKHNLGIVRPIQYLKTVYQAGNTKTSSVHPAFLDVKLEATGKNKYEVTLVKNDSAFAYAKITVTHPAGWEKILSADKDGKATFTSVGPALYLVSVEWIDKTPGKFKDKPYETVRHQLDFSLYNE
ncbi:MAG: DUF4198 domain-containing protein [Bacteroidota bacterium]